MLSFLLLLEKKNSAGIFRFPEVVLKNVFLIAAVLLSSERFFQWHFVPSSSVSNVIPLVIVQGFFFIHFLFNGNLGRSWEGGWKYVVIDSGLG